MGVVGHNNTIATVLVQGFSLSTRGRTFFGAPGAASGTATVTTVDAALDAQNRLFGQEYDNAVELLTTTSLLGASPLNHGSGIVFGFTIDATTPPSAPTLPPTGQSLRLVTVGTVTLTNAVGKNVALQTLEIGVSAGMTQPASAPIISTSLLLEGFGNYDFSKADNQIGTFGAKVSGAVTINETSSLTISSVQPVVTSSTPVSGVTVQGNFIVTLNDPVTPGIAPLSPLLVTIATDIDAIGGSAIFDGTQGFRVPANPPTGASSSPVQYSILPSVESTIFIAGTNVAPTIATLNTFTLQPTGGATAKFNKNPAAFPLGDQMSLPPGSAFNRDGFITFSGGSLPFQAIFFYNIDQIAKLSISADSFLDATGTPQIQISAKLGQNTNVQVPIVPSPGLNPFIISPAVNSPFPPGPDRVAIAPVIPGEVVPDLIVADGPGQGPQVTVISGSAIFFAAAGTVNTSPTSSAILAQFLAFPASYLGGVNLAVADLHGTGIDSIITSTANGSDLVAVYSAAGMDPITPTQHDFAQVELFHAFGGFGGGVQIAATSSTAFTPKSVIFAAPGAGSSGTVEAFDGATGTMLSSFGTGFTGGVVLGATNNLIDMGTIGLLAGEMSNGSAIDLLNFTYPNFTLGQQLVAAAFPAAAPGKISPIGSDNPPSGSASGVGSLVFEPDFATFFAGTAFSQAQNGEILQFTLTSVPAGLLGTVAADPVPTEVQLANLLTADPPFDAGPALATSFTTNQVVAPGATGVIHFTVGSALYSAQQLTVTATSSNQGLLPNSDLVLTGNGGNYTLSINAPAGTNTGLATVSINVSDPQNVSSMTNFNVTIDNAPSLPAINSTNSVTLTNGQSSYSDALGASSPDGNLLTYSATLRGDSLLFDEQNAFQFQGMGYATFGATAYVLHSNQPGNGVGGYYLVRPSDGALFPYDGSGSYAHSFTGTAIATLGANVFTDPSLLLNAQPPADYTTLYNIQTGTQVIPQGLQLTGLGYATAGATAYVLQSPTSHTTASNGSNPYYLLRSDGSLFAYDGSGSFSHTFTTTTPIASLGSTVFAFPNELTNAIATPSLYAQLYQLRSQFDLQELNGSFYTNTYGHQAEWIYSPVPNQFGQHWYTLTLNAGGTQAILRAWEGYSDSAVGATIATLDPSVYSHPTWLTTATYSPNPAATATVDPLGKLTIQAPNSAYVGTFKVDVTASDGLLSTTQTVTVTSSHAAPTITVLQGSTQIPNNSTFNPLSISALQNLTVNIADSASLPVTTAATVSTYDPLFATEQRYQLKGLGYYSAGAAAYVLSSPNMNSFGNNYYLLRADGGLYAYDGSGSYAHTFSNSSPLANFGAAVYSDPNLLINSQPPIDYTSLHDLLQKFQFQGLGWATVGDSAYVLSSTTMNSFGNPYYLLKADGGLYAYDGSGSYAHSFATGTPIATVDPAVYVNPFLLLNAQAGPALYAQLYPVEAQYDLQEYQGSFYTGLYGHAAKWLYSPVPNANGTHWYTLVLSPDGNQALLYAYDGSTNSVPAAAQPLAGFDSSVYFNPSLLLNAKAPAAATGASATITGGVLALNTPTGFAGNLQVTLTASDGGLSTTQNFQVAFTEPAPALYTVAAQSASQSGAPLQVTLGPASSLLQPVTYSATSAGYNAAYRLQQVYQFTGLGYATNNGVSAYVLYSNVLGGVGGYYLMNSSGAVYAYDGSGSYAHTFANSANLVATLDPGVYISPTLLTHAQAPVAPAALLSVNGNTLTINVAGVPVGTIFELFVTASDGAKSTRTSFLVTVTA
jgi:hypothetical protein